MLLAVTLVIVLILVGAGSDLAGLSGAIGAAWLAVHLAPIEISGAPLTAAPLVPAMVVAWSVARLSRKVAREGAGSPARIGAILAAAVAGPMVLAAGAYLLVRQASSVAAMAPGPFWVSLGAVYAVYAVGAVIGVWPMLWSAAVSWFALPSWAAIAGRAARQGALVLVAGAVLMTAVLLGLSIGKIAGMFDAPIGILGVLGVTVLSVLYVPTVLVGVIAVLVGSSVRVGDVDVSLFAATGGAQPIPLPIMAVLPETPAAGWWPLLVVVAAVAGVRVGMVCAHNLPDRVAAIKAVALAAVVSGLIAGALGWLVGGSAGSRVEVQINTAGLAGGLTGWLLVVGAITVAVLFHLGDDFLGDADPLLVAQRAGRELDGRKGGGRQEQRARSRSTAEKTPDAPEKVDLEKSEPKKKVTLEKVTLEKAGSEKADLEKPDAEKPESKKPDSEKVEPEKAGPEPVKVEASTAEKVDTTGSDAPTADAAPSDPPKDTGTDQDTGTEQGD